MALTTITRKAATIQGFQLTSSDDMFAALKHIAPAGYFGAVTIDASTVWHLNFQSASTGESYTGSINDVVIIENNAIASICPAGKFTSLFQT